MISISQSSVEWEMNFTCKPHFCKAIDFNFLAMPHSTRDLISPTRDRIYVPCHGSVESWSLNGQGIPRSHILKTVLPLAAGIPEWLCKGESPCTKTKIPIPILQSHWEKFTSLLVSHKNSFFFFSSLNWKQGVLINTSSSGSPDFNFCFPSNTRLLEALPRFLAFLVPLC